MVQEDGGIWLRTAKKGEKLESLESIIAADSLKGTTLGVYDVVMGNPPWGAGRERNVRNRRAPEHFDKGKQRKGSHCQRARFCETRGHINVKRQIRGEKPKRRGRQRSDSGEG